MGKGFIVCRFSVQPGAHRNETGQPAWVSPACMLARPCLRGRSAHYNTWSIAQIGDPHRYIAPALADSGVGPVASQSGGKQAIHSCRIRTMMPLHECR